MERQTHKPSAERRLGGAFPTRDALPVSFLVTLGLFEGLKRNLGGSEIMPLYTGIRTRRGEIILIEGRCAKLDEHQRHRPFSCATSRAMKS